MTKYVLAVDIGVNSIGWAVLERRGRRRSKIVRCGVRYFPESHEAISSANLASVTSRLYSVIVNFLKDEWKWLVATLVALGSGPIKELCDAGVS
jgi:hypothetical protein